MTKFFVLFLIPFWLLATPSYYLTWNDDPTTTMVISWLETSKKHTFSFQGKNAAWQNPVISRTVLSQSHILARVQLRNLTPDRAYRMRFNDEEIGKRFQTLPRNLDRSLTFAAGGDVYYGNGKLYRKMCQTVAKKEPAFVILGGDIAYTLKKGLPKGSQSWEVKRWETFFNIWSEEMGSIPLLVVVGNHDMSRKNGDDLQSYIVSHLFAFERTYRAFVLGHYALFLLLDTDHFSPIQGEQSEWLENTLAQYAHVPFKSAHYHIAAYPSYAPYDGSKPKKIRQYWVPLFEKYRLNTGFENHNHTYKRTYPLLNSEPHPDGIVYLGDGSWGVPLRKPHPAPYLAKAELINAFYLITLMKTGHAIESFDIEGKSIEQIPL